MKRQFDEKIGLCFI